jgi:hypothetical protein
MNEIRASSLGYRVAAVEDQVIDEGAWPDFLLLHGGQKIREGMTLAGVFP